MTLAFFAQLEPSFDLADCAPVLRWRVEDLLPELPNTLGHEELIDDIVVDIDEVETVVATRTGVQHFTKAVDMNPSRVDGFDILVAARVIAYIPGLTGRARTTTKFRWRARHVQ